MIYIRYLNESGHIDSKFLSVNELKGCTSDDIFSSLMSVVDNKKIEISKLMKTIFLTEYCHSKLCTYHQLNHGECMTN
jgi:hypothetical protein